MSFTVCKAQVLGILSFAMDEPEVGKACNLRYGEPGREQMDELSVKSVNKRDAKRWILGFINTIRTSSVGQIKQATEISETNSKIKKNFRSQQQYAEDIASTAKTLQITANKWKFKKINRALSFSRLKITSVEKSGKIFRLSSCFYEIICSGVSFHRQAPVIPTRAAQSTTPTPLNT